MIGKRITAHILNRIILFVPTMLLLGGLSYLINPNYFIFGNDQSSGWLLFFLIKYMLCLPTVFLDFLLRPSSEFLGILEIIVPALLCLILIESMSIFLLKRTIGMKVMGLSLVSVNNKPLSVFQIPGRTITKYVTLAFFPFALVYIVFNKEKMTLHDKIFGTRVVRR